MSLPGVVWLGGVAVLYVATAMLGLSLDAVSGFAAVVWPPTGIALAALVLYGYRLWPAVAVGAFFVNWSVGAPVLVAGGMALGNTLEAVVGAVLLKRVVGFQPALERLRDVLGLVVLAAGLSPIVSATIGVTSGWLGGIIPAEMVGKAWHTWWLGDALGVLVVAPLLFVWSGAGRAALSRRWVAEAVVLVVAIGVPSLVLFSSILVTNLQLRYIVFPSLIWAAVRLGPPGAATAAALIAVSAVWGTVQGFGPFAGPTLLESLTELQVFMGIVAVTGLVLAAVVAERGQAESAREHLAAIVDSSEDAIIGKTLDGTITTWNRGAERLYGYTMAEVIGRSITLLCPPDIPDDIPRILERLARGEPIEHYEAQRQRKDGTRLDVSLTISPIRDPGRRVIGAATIARDITERRRAQQRFTLTVDAAPNAMILVDQHGRILLANTHTERLFGYTQEELLGQNIDMLVPEHIRPAHRCHRVQFVQQPSTRAMGAGRDLYGRRKDGTEVPVEIGLNPMETPEGLCILAAIVDITTRKQAEQAVQRAYTELEQRVEARTVELRTANEALHREMAAPHRLEQEAQRAEHFVMLGRLAAGVSHEIRNPLSAVSLHVDVLAEEFHAPSPQSQAVIAESLTEVKTQLARLEELVQNYLSLARVAHLAVTPQDLGDNVEEWAKEWRALSAAQGVTLQLAGIADCGVVAFHESTLRRVLLNLVQNALDAMPQGGTLTVTGQGTATHVELQLHDTGSGIPAEQLPRIFEPLYTTKPRGTGLGLYIVQEIVAAHGGELTVQSVAGQGTTFTVTLPRAPGS